MSYQTENNVSSIEWNFNGEAHWHIVGSISGITKITENTPSGEGDKWHYDVYRDDILVERIFNVDSVVYLNEKIKEIL